MGRQARQFRCERFGDIEHIAKTGIPRIMIGRDTSAVALPALGATRKGD